MKTGQAIGRVLRQRRSERQISQDTLAERSGIARATISRIENGEIENPGIVTITAICKALRLDVDALLERAGLVVVRPSKSRNKEAQRLKKLLERLRSAVEGAQNAHASALDAQRALEEALDGMSEVYANASPGGAARIAGGSPLCDA